MDDMEEMPDWKWKLPPSNNFVTNGDVYLYGVMDDTVSKWVMPELHKMLRQSLTEKEPRLTIHINSYGGDSDVCKEVITWMEMAKELGYTICTQVFAKAYSAASIIAAAGSKNHRFISPYGEHLCHLGRVDWGPLANDVEAERASKSITRHFQFVRDCYKKYASIKNLDRVIKDDNLIFVGEEVIDNGLADFLAF